MSWNYFIYFAVIAVLSWAAGAFAAWKDKPRMAYGMTIVGLLVFFAFICWMEKDLVQGVLGLLKKRK